MENQELLTISEMAARLKVPMSWLYSRTRIKNTDFPVVRVGKYCRFNPDAVLSWIKEKYGEARHESA
jgi:excisionase family DNA binding protein